MADDLTEVPCKGCTECCRHNSAVFLHPGEGDDVRSYQVRAIARPENGELVFLLATKENKECVYLGPDGCTIYERRPFLCRSFDCRKHYLILPKQDRVNLVNAGLSAQSVFDAAKSRVGTLSAAERKECREKRKEYFS
ncbi:MAG: YkgJ family cysteine cluster protein [Acidobacteriota bacterium]|nr:YkgJ family cysteine cluster protein [Acidobacteriota bacterium]